MKTQLLLILTLAVSYICTVPARAQEMYRVSFQSACRTTDDSGKIVTRTLRNRDIIRDCAAQSWLGATNNLRGVELVYHQNATFQGDTIEVRTVTNAVLVCEVLRVFFGTDIWSADGTTRERLAFLFTSLQTDPIGSVVITERPIRDRFGNISRSVIRGRIQFVNNVNFPGRAAICTGTFTVGKPMEFVQGN
jgi:hypothetical protein